MEGINILNLLIVTLSVMNLMMGILTKNWIAIFGWSVAIMGWTQLIQK